MPVIPKSGVTEVVYQNLQRFNLRTDTGTLSMHACHTYIYITTDKTANLFGIVNNVPDYNYRDIFTMEIHAFII